RIDPRRRPSRHRRAVEGVRDGARLHRAGRIVAPQSPSGPGSADLSRAQGGAGVRERHARRSENPLQVRPLVLSLHRLQRAGLVLQPLLSVLNLVDISLRTHYELYHDWRKALEFCRALPDVSPPEPITFHMYWRERHGRWWPSVRRFGRKQALPVK